MFIKKKISIIEHYAMFMLMVKNVQEELLVAGLAEIKYVKPPDTRYLEKYKKAQNKAKSNRRNLWSDV